MGQGSIIIEKETTEEMMNIQEVARTIEWLRAKGLSDTEINDLLTYIATGVGLPKEPTEREST